MPELAKTFVVLSPVLSATPVEVTPDVFQALDRRFDGFRGHTLLASFSFAQDWDTWERHPAGDETVVLVSGQVRMVLEEAGGERSVELEKPGDFVIVPKGIWHRAETDRPTTMIFLTPGEGTENRPRRTAPTS